MLTLPAEGVSHMLHCFYTYSPSQYYPGGPSHWTKTTRRNKREKKSFLCANDMIVYVKNSNDGTKQQLPLNYEFISLFILVSFILLILI